jgi:TonB family protein
MMLIRLQLACFVLALLPPYTVSDRVLQVGSTNYGKAQAAKSEGTIDPLSIRLTNPTFSKEAKKTKARGQIVLSIHITTDGTVTDASVVSGKPGLIDSALRAVRQWHYLPAMHNGEFVEATKEITINYDFGKNSSQPEELARGDLSNPPQDLLKDVAEGKVFRVGVGSGVTAPRAVLDPDPEYTEEARRDRFRGQVLLGVVVGADGQPRDVWVVRALGHGLDLASVNTVKHWRFSPATRNGEPVAIVLNVETSFDIY